MLERLWVLQPITLGTMKLSKCLKDQSPMEYISGLMRQGEEQIKNIGQISCKVCYKGGNVKCSVYCSETSKERLEVSQDLGQVIPEENSAIGFLIFYHY